MPTSKSKLTIKDHILRVLSEGQKTSDEIKEVVSGKPSSIDKNLSLLVKSGEIERVDKGVYRINAEQDAPPPVKNLRKSSDNTETINKMLNLFDKLLDGVAVSIEEEDWTGVVEKIETIKSLRWMGSTIDQLMKRWYLVDRGYDTNTRQAAEDAKHKTEEREKQEIEQLPPDKRIKVICSYDVTMEELIKKLPGKVDHEV